MYIASNIEGRLRIRDSQFRDTSRTGHIRETLLNFPGIQDIIVNPKVGSILVAYNRGSITPKEIVSLIAKDAGIEVPEDIHGNSTAKNILPKCAHGPLSLLKPGVSRRRLIKRGLLASIALNLVGASLDLKQLHVVAGFIFTGILGIHLYDKRRLLLQ